MKYKSSLWIVFTFFLFGCNPLNLFDRAQQTINPAGEVDLVEEIKSEEQAQAVLTNFYILLNQGAYDQAALLYGGSYDMLQDFNPGIDPGDKISLLRAGCEINGLMCLTVLNLAFAQVNDQQEFVYEVIFANPDGSPFALGPCCGATEEEMPPVNLFDVRVTCAQDEPCQVLDLPPYVP